MADRDRRTLIAAAVLVLGVTVAAAEAGQTPGRDVQARLTWKKGYRDIELTIVRKEERFTRKLGTTYFRAPKLVVRDLDADGEPEVWVDTYTGGAHCCFESRFFRWSPKRETYTGTFHSWADVGYRAKNLDGRGSVELVSADARFAYVFTDFADSSFPLQIWHFEAGRLSDVTRRFPGEVDLDAKALWRRYLERRRNGDVRGVLAAWLADQYLLDREQAGWNALEAANRRGELGAAGDFWPWGAAYLKALRAFLLKTGYA